MFSIRKTFKSDSHVHDWYFERLIKPLWFPVSHQSIRIDKCKCGAMKSKREDYIIIGEPDSFNIKLITNILTLTNYE